MSDSDLLRSLTGLAGPARDQAIAYYRGLPEPERIKIHKDQSAAFIRLRQENRNVPRSVLSYAAQVAAAMKHRALMESISRKKALDADQLEAIAEARINTIRGRRSAREGSNTRFLRLYLHLVDRLRNEGLSWREISNYIAKYHKKKISHTHIRNVCLQLGEALQIGQSEQLEYSE